MEKCAKYFTLEHHTNYMCYYGLTSLQTDSEEKTTFTINGLGSLLLLVLYYSQSEALYVHECMCLGLAMSYGL